MNNRQSFHRSIIIYMYMVYFLICIITDNINTLESNNGHTHHRRHHNHQKTRRNNLNRKDEQGDIESSRTSGGWYSWNRKLLPPLSPTSILFDQPKNERARHSKLPNIIFILTDDQDVELGSMNFMPKTLKILGEGGVHFPNAYVTTPMCCPSRSSSLTGLYVHNHNVYTNNDNCSSQYWQTTYETRTFANYLNNAGYRTAFFGKYLNEYNGSYIPPGWREWSGLIRNSRFYNYTLNVNGNKVKHGDVYQFDYYPDLIINDSLHFLSYSKRFFANKPLLMVLSFPGPHGPEDAAPQFQNLFMNVTTHRTPSWNYAPNYDKQWLLRNTGKMEQIHVDFTDLLHTKRLQTLQSVDESVEKLYNELIEIGELDNTYIFYTSDHGYHLGQFGLVKGKAMPFEFDVKVPFYVRGPKIPGGQKIDNIVLNIDLAPTFLDIAGVKVPEHMDGNSILPLLKSTYEPEYKSNNVKTEWRDTFIIERGKSTRENEMGIGPQSKKEWLATECKKREYNYPCNAYQKFECYYDGYETRIRKCRKSSYWSKTISRRVHKQKCICQTEDQINKSRLDAYEKKLQRRFLKEHVINKHFRPIFIGSRSKRDIIMHNSFDVDGVYELSKLLDASTTKIYNDSSIFSNTYSPISRSIDSTTCVILSNLTVSCSHEIYQNKHVWRKNKDRLDSIIKKLQVKLVQLKGIRRHLNEKRPLHLLEGQNQQGHIQQAHIQQGHNLQAHIQDNDHCNCNKAERRNRGFKHRLSHPNRFRMHLRKVKKLRRKTKFENTTCNYEKMNCFTHDNDHWKTAPFWTKGAFCFCQNANNNSYWCIRTINATHNFLYCEFITGFITYYNLRNDPFQLKNSIYDLEFSTLEELRGQLNKLKNCAGAKQCNMRYKIANNSNNNNNIDDSSNANLKYFSKSRSERKIISI